jgi:hypothetical protein
MDEPDRKAAARKVLDDPDGGIARAGVDDDDFRETRKAGEAFSDARFLVFADDRGGDRQRGVRAGGALGVGRVRLGGHASTVDGQEGRFFRPGT